MRIGMGYDVHRLQEGCKLIMGGVEIPYEKGLLGHSDADVLVHAVMDALLGAAALGDIGKHFPDKGDDRGRTWLYRSRRGYFCAGDLSVKQSDGTLRPECDQRLRRLRRLWRAVSPPVAWRNLCKVTGTLGQLSKLASEPSPAA